MPNKIINCDVVYCEGWDPESRSIVRPVSEATARARDAAGEQYSVVFLAEERPLAVLDVCWSAHYAATWLFDEHGRRDRLIDVRRFPTADGEGIVVVRAIEQWAYESPEQREFDTKPSVWRTKLDTGSEEFDSSTAWDHHPVVRLVKITGPVAAFGERTWDELPVARPATMSWPVAAFGDWVALARLEEVFSAPVVLTERADPPETPGLAPADLPWHPPKPAPPLQLDEIFVAGARFRFGNDDIKYDDSVEFEDDVELDDGIAVTVEIDDGGRLRLPSGRLIAADPVPEMHEYDPFVETVEPGEYPVVLSVVRFPVRGGHTRVAAGKLVVSDAETVSWDPALRPGEDVRMLGDDCLFTIGVDAGCLAIVDADVAEAYEDTIEDFYLDIEGHVTELPEPQSGANLLAIDSGWGDGAYPVWVGRAADGSVTCFVFDFLVLRYAEHLT